MISIMVEIFVQPLVGGCCAGLYLKTFSQHMFVESADYCAGLAGNFRDSSIRCIQASKSSSIFSVRTAVHRRQFFPFSLIPVWRN